jgi:hypothetical protein
MPAGKDVEVSPPALARRWMVVWPSWSAHLTDDGTPKGKDRTTPVTTVDGQAVDVGGGGWATFPAGAVVDASIGCTVEHLDLMTSLGALRGAPA